MHAAYAAQLNPEQLHCTYRMAVYDKVVQQVLAEQECSETLAST